MSPGGRAVTAIGVLAGAFFAYVIANLVLSKACRGSGAETELVRAVRAGDRARVSEILDKDRALVTAIDRSGGGYVRPLHEAVRKGDVAMVRLLLEKGVTPNATEEGGKTALHEWARTEQKPEILDALLAHHADLEAADTGGNRPLHLAVLRRDWPDGVDLLVTRGARLESRNADGDTPLLYALLSGGYRSAAALCAHGVDLAPAPDRRGRGVPELLAYEARSPKATWTDRLIRFYGPGGGCAALVARFRSGGPVPAAVRQAVVAENDCLGGEAWRCQELAVRYEKGDGVPADGAKASELFGKACDGGQLWSCGRQAFRLANGEGVARDLPRALALYDRTCQAGDAFSCHSLAYYVERGEGLAKDAVRAEALYRKACEGGQQEACAALKERTAAR